MLLFQAAILQQTTEHVHNLEQEKTKLLAQNAHLKNMLMEMERVHEERYNGSPPPKRKKRDTGTTQSVYKHAVFTGNTGEKN